MVNDSDQHRFLADAVLHYDGTDAPGRRTSARAQLARHPELAGASIWAAAAAADHGALLRILTADPSSARAFGGPKNWEPLLYVAYSRVPPSAAGDEVERCVQSLLDAGADPDAGYLPAGARTPFTALTGLFGGGEEGHSAQPAHSHHSTLARLLLTAGADPNDAQTLYNRMFTPADDHLELLFEHGLGSGDGGPWHRRDPGSTDTPEQMLRGQLAWAVTQGYADRIALLARHGVDLQAPLDAGHLPVRTPRTPLELAVVAGRQQSVDMLRQLGADAPLDPATQLVGAMLDGDIERAAQIEIDHPDVLGAVRRDNPSLVLRAAVADRLAAIEVLIERGFDVDAFGRADVVIEEPWETALHHAAGAGKLDLARLLLRRGADRQLLDHRFGATPAQWATFFGRTEVATLLA